MSGIEPTQIDYQGIKMVSADDTQSITFKMEGTNKGMIMDYDLTSIPKQFKITPSGINWTDGTSNHTTGLERLALVQTAFQAVELPPNGTTLKLNDTILLDGGSQETLTINEKSIVGANDDGTGILTNMTLKNDFGGQQFLSFGSSVPFGYSNNLLVQLASGGSGCGISHFDSFPTPSDFTISTDQNLALSSSKNLTLTADNVDLSSAGTLIIPSPIATNNLQYTQPTSNFKINQGTTGGVANPIISLNQNDTASGACNMTFYKNTFTNGSAIGELTFRAKTAITGNPEREYARIGGTIRSNTSGNVDGSITLQARINDVLTELMRINGQDAQIEIFQPLDLNDNDIVSSTGDIELNATASAGNGNVNISAKSTGVINLNSNVVMDNSESLMIRNTGGSIYNSQTQSVISLVDITNLSNTLQHQLTPSQQLFTQQFINTYTNNSSATQNTITETATGVDIKKLTLGTNLITMNDSSASPTIEQVDITPTSITFNSSGSTSDGLSIYNDSADGGEITWINSTGSNGLTIDSNKALTLKASVATQPLQLDSDVLNLVNTNTTTAVQNHTSSLGTTSNIGDITNYLKLQLNGVDIWIPYFTSDPSL